MSSSSEIKKLKLEEESASEKKEGEYYFDFDNNAPNDFVAYATGRRMTPEHREKYLRQIDESDGFDITLDLELGEDLGIGSPIVPLRHKTKDPEIIELSHMAIYKFNYENGQNYRFLKILTVNASAAAGMWYYITFHAKDVSYAQKDTFQAMVWSGIDGERDVHFCRLKKISSSSHQGDEISPDSDVGKR